MAVAEDSGMIHDIVQAYLSRLGEHHVPVWRVYLFGSYAKGTAHPDSDIDLAIFLDQDEIDGFREDVHLMRLRWGIDLRIEPHAFARSDFQDMDPYVREIVASGQRVF
ncbi:MAG: nucleotidyltransferase domain-containing protein [Candidatus Hydrogenedentes bacterium]|nr:nucleotidyltransferase domain-containing protein [Candidatus Hydrogenedentota bacterium]